MVLRNISPIAFGFAAIHWLAIMRKPQCEAVEPIIEINPTRIDDLLTKHCYKNDRISSEFKICFNNRNRQPSWVLERHVIAPLSKNATEKSIVKRNNCHFHSDELVSEQFRVFPNEYLNNNEDMDRGHLVPAGDFHHSQVLLV